MLNLVDLRLAQIFPMDEEDSDVASMVKSASFADPYLLIMKDDGSASILEADNNGDIYEPEQSEALVSFKWETGCVYKSTVNDHKAVLSLLTETGTIKVWE